MAEAAQEGTDLDPPQKLKSGEGQPRRAPAVQHIHLRGDCRNTSGNVKMPPPEEFHTTWRLAHLSPTSADLPEFPVDPQDDTVAKLSDQLVTHEIHYHVIGNVYQGDVISVPSVPSPPFLSKVGTPVQRPKLLSPSRSSPVPFGQDQAEEEMPEGYAETFRIRRTSNSVDEGWLQSMRDHPPLSPGGKLHWSRPVQAESSSDKPTPLPRRRRTDSNTLIIQKSRVYEEEDSNRYQSAENLETISMRSSHRTSPVKAIHPSRTKGVSAPGSPVVQTNKETQTLGTHEEQVVLVPYKHLTDVYKKEARNVIFHRPQKFQIFEPLIYHYWTKIRNVAITSTYENLPGVTSPATEQDGIMVDFLEISKPVLIVEDNEAFLKTYAPHIKDALICGRELARSLKYLHAVLIFYSLGKVHLSINGGDDSVYGIRVSVYEIRVVAEKMAKDRQQRSIVLDNVIPLLRELVTDMRKVPNATHDVVSEQEAWCLLRIAGCYEYCGKNRKSIENTEAAIELMQREFGERATEFELYAFCLNNAGIAYQKIGDTEKATRNLTMALDAKQRAKWTSEEEKAKSIALTQKKLDQMRLILRK